MTVRAFALRLAPHVTMPSTSVLLPPLLWYPSPRILPSLLPPVRPNPHPRLMLSCRPLLLRHHHLLSTPIASSPHPAATTISFALPIRPLRLLLLPGLLRPRYRLLCTVSSTPPSHLAPIPPPHHLLLWSPPLQN